MTVLVPDPMLDPFRQAVGELIHQDEVVGYVATQVACIVDAVGGRLWWTRWGDPYEFLTLVVVASTPGSPLPEWDDPWWFVDGNYSDIRDLGSGRFSYPDQRDGIDGEVAFHVRWLSGAAREAAWADLDLDPPLGVERDNR